MKQRLLAINRVLEFQKERRRLAEWKLVALQRQEIALDERHNALVRFLEDDTAFAGPFATALMKRLRGVTEAKAQVAEQRYAQTQHLLEEVRRVGRAERVSEVIEREFRRHDERQQLAEAIEAATARRRASFP